MASKVTIEWWFNDMLSNKSRLGGLKIMTKVIVALKLGHFWHKRSSDKNNILGILRIKNNIYVHVLEVKYIIILLLLIEFWRQRNISK